MQTLGTINIQHIHCRYSTGHGPTQYVLYLSTISASIDYSITGLHIRCTEQRQRQTGEQAEAIGVGRRLGSSSACSVGGRICLRPAPRGVSAHVQDSEQAQLMDGLGHATWSGQFLLSNSIILAKSHERLLH